MPTCRQSSTSTCAAGTPKAHEKHTKDTRKAHQRHTPSLTHTHADRLACLCSSFIPSAHLPLLLPVSSYLLPPTYYTLSDRGALPLCCLSRALHRSQHLSQHLYLSREHLYLRPASQFIQNRVRDARHIRNVGESWRALARSNCYRLRAAKLSVMGRHRLEIKGKAHQLPAVQYLCGRSAARTTTSSVP